MKKVVSGNTNSFFANFAFLLFQKIINYFAQIFLVNIVVACLIGILFFYTSVFQKNFFLFSFFGSSWHADLYLNDLIKIISLLALVFFLVKEILKLFFKKDGETEIEISLKNKIIIGLVIIVLIHFFAIASVFFNEDIAKDNSKSFFLLFFSLLLFFSIFSFFLFLFFSWAEEKINKWRFEKFGSLVL